MNPSEHLRHEAYSEIEQTCPNCLAYYQDNPMSRSDDKPLGMSVETQVLMKWDGKTIIRVTLFCENCAHEIHGDLELNWPTQAATG